MGSSNLGDDRERRKLLNATDDEGLVDARVIRQTVVAIHALVMQQDRRMKELERNVRDIKYGVVMLLMAGFVYSITWYLMRE